MTTEPTYYDSSTTLLKKILLVLNNGGGGGGGETNVLTTPGDLLYRGATTNQRLPIGNNNEVLSVSGGLPIWRAEESYIDGVVNNPTELPITIGEPAINSVYLSLGSSGVWLINRKPAGLYNRVGNMGDSSDWVYLGAFPEVNSSANWELYDGTDPTKELKFDLTAIQSGNTRTISIPNLSGTMALTGVSQDVSFGSLTGNNGTLTSSTPVLDLTQTWNNGAVAFTGMRLNCVQTANSTSSSYFTISRTGTPIFQIVAQSPNIPLIEMGAGGFITRIRGRTSAGVGLNFDNIIGVNTSLQFGVGSTTGAGDVHISREAADILAMIRSTNPQTFRLYGTSTDTNNWERGFIRWSAAGGSFQIGTEAAGTGVIRPIQFPLGTITASTPLEITQTWNNSGVIFTTLRLNATNTASAAGSLLMDLQTGGITQLSVRRDGVVSASNYYRFTGIDAGLFVHSAGGGIISLGASPNNWMTLSNTRMMVSGDLSIGRALSAGQSADTILSRDAAGILAQYNAANPQTYRLYNTVSGTNNVNFERANFRWASNEFIIDAEAGGTGTSLRGIKIGSAITSLLGFYGKTPVDQPATVADPAGGGTVDTEARTAINAIIDRLQELGLIA